MLVGGPRLAKVAAPKVPRVTEEPGPCEGVETSSKQFSAFQHSGVGMFPLILTVLKRGFLYPPPYYLSPSRTVSTKGEHPNSGVPMSRVRGARCPACWTKIVLAVLEAVIVFLGHRCSPKAKLSSLLDVCAREMPNCHFLTFGPWHFFIHWNFLACPHTLSLFGD